MKAFEFGTWKDRCTCERLSERKGQKLKIWYRQDPGCPVAALHGPLPSPTVIDIYYPTMKRRRNK